ncbi:hypothetical protein EON66_09685 [archaeon]|nr:MAG: hypothetical protein EON66_09685 [archaeon]
MLSVRPAGRDGSRPPSRPAGRTESKDVPRVRWGSALGDALTALASAARNASSVSLLGTCMVRRLVRAGTVAWVWGALGSESGQHTLLLRTAAAGIK